MIRHAFMILMRSKFRNFILSFQFLLSFFAIVLLVNQIVYMIGEYKQDMGYKIENALVGEFLNLPLVTNEAEFNDLYSQMSGALIELNQHPDIEAAGYMDRVPYTGSSSNDQHTIIRMTPEAVTAYGFNFLEGQNFSEEDETSLYTNIIINEAAQQAVDDLKSGAVGKRFYFPTDSVNPNASPEDSYKISGVIKNLMPNGRFLFFNQNHDKAVIYLYPFNGDNTYYKNNYGAFSRQLGTFFIRYKPDAKASIERTTYDIFRQNMPTINVRMDFLTDKDKQMAGVAWFVLGMFVFLSIVLFAIIVAGVVGVMNESLNKRLKEIGVRVALGSNEKQVVKQFIGEMAVISGSSFILGIAIVILINPQMSLVVVSASTLILATVIFLSTYIPTSKTSRVKPNEALHYE